MRSILTIIIALFHLTSLAQDNNEAKTLLDQVAAKLKDYKAVELDFDLTMENKAEGILETHHGKAYMKGNFYRLNIMGVENYFDGKNIYSYMPDVEEVNIKYPSNEEEEFLNPTTIFEIHNQGFKQKIVKTEGNIVYIDLEPESKDRSFTKIVIKLNRSTKNIERVTSYGKDGNLVHVDIKNIKAITPTPQDSFFKFDSSAHPNVEVIDLRD